MRRLNSSFPRVRHALTSLEAMADRYFWHIFAVATCLLAAWCLASFRFQNGSATEMLEMRGKLFAQAFLWPLATWCWQLGSPPRSRETTSWQEHILLPCLIVATFSFSVLLWRFGLAESLGLHPRWWEVRRTFSAETYDGITTSTN